jgi:hypothetical protein
MVGSRAGSGGSSGTASEALEKDRSGTRANILSQTESAVTALGGRRQKAISLIMQYCVPTTSGVADPDDCAARNLESLRQSVLRLADQAEAWSAGR